MKRLVCLLAAVIALPLVPANSVYASDNSGSATVRGPHSITRTITLQYVTPSRFLSFLFEFAASSGIPDLAALFKGIERIDSDEAARTITIRGSSEAIAQTVKMQGYLDVQAKTIALHVEIMRFRNPENRQDLSVQTVGSDEAVIQNNEAADVFGWSGDRLLHASVGVHANGDRSISIRTSLTSQALNAEQKSQSTAAKAEIIYNAFERLQDAGALVRKEHDSLPIADLKKIRGNMIGGGEYFVVVTPTVVANTK